MSVRLFVGNLSDHITEAELREHFSAVGPLSYIHLPTERESGRPRKFAFVQFNDPGQAEEAVRRFNHRPFQGKPLTVNQARARESGPGVRKNPAAPLSVAATDGVTEPGVADTRPPQRGGASRHFGPDAAPRGQRKPANRHPKSGRSPKGPIRERFSGQFFGGDEDDGGEASNRGHFARGQSDPERDDHD
jgi:RNA recognition motif-containing protein